MTEPTGRWLNANQWQCPKCAWVNGSADERCQKCHASVRPPADEPARPLDPLDLVGHDPSLTGQGPVERATKALQALTRVTRDKAIALFGEGLRTGLTNRGEKGDRAWQAIAEMPESEQHAALAALVDNLEQEGVALYRVDENGRA